MIWNDSTDGTVTYEQDASIMRADLVVLTRLTIRIEELHENLHSQQVLLVETPENALADVKVPKEARG